MAAEHLRQALRAEVALAVGPVLAPHLRWSTSQLPTLRDVLPLRSLLLTTGTDVDTLLVDTSALTLFEASDGNWERVAANLPLSTWASVQSLSAAFTIHVLPSSSAVATRAKHWRCWRGVLTWAVARRCLSSLLPMSEDVMHAFLMELLLLGCGFSSIKGYLDSIQSRHRVYALSSPLHGVSSYSRLCRTLRRFQGRQAPYKYPIHRTLVAKILAYPAPSLAIRRDCLAAALATICCLRPCEGARLQSCDIFFDFDVRSGLRGFEGTAAVNIMARKNDQGRKGHHPRIGRSKSPVLDLVHQLRVYLKSSRLTPRDGCSKRLRPHARCPVCPALFPLSVLACDRHSARGNQCPSPAAFSDMILRALSHIGCDVSAFSGVCARRGGISTAVEAGVPESILWLQSGHAQSRAAARTYIRLRNPTLLYATWQAFAL